jgi:hypothetical protein
VKALVYQIDNLESEKSFVSSSDSNKQILFQPNKSIPSVSASTSSSFTIPYLSEPKVSSKHPPYHLDRSPISSVSSVFTHNNSSISNEDVSFRSSEVIGNISGSKVGKISNEKTLSESVYSSKSGLLIHHVPTFFSSSSPIIVNIGEDKINLYKA